MVVGVNRAAEAHACDVWAATDHTLIRRCNPIGTPILLTIRATRDSLARRGRPWPYLVVTHSGVAGQTVTNKHHPWTRYTTTAALYFLAWMGATYVDVYGCDWSGVDDWDGQNSEPSRTDNRWRAEHEIWDGIIEQTGIKVHRWA